MAPYDAQTRAGRSVDSLQKLYTVVIALAIGQAIQRLIVLSGGQQAFATPDEVVARPPAAAAFFTIVPFYHGMNRHLDRCYVEAGGGDANRLRGGLLLDFFIFFVEAALFFAIATSISAGFLPFILLGVLFLVICCGLPPCISRTTVSPRNPASSDGPCST